MPDASSDATTVSQPEDRPGAHGGATVVEPRRTTFLPREHGSWSLALEPLALGLLAAPSAGGGALAVVVLAGFFARRPLRAAFARNPSNQRRSARQALVLFATIAIAATIELGALGRFEVWWFLAPAAVCAGVFVGFDLAGRWRARVAEIAGGAAFSLMAGACAALAGWTTLTALALTATMLARSLPTVLTVAAVLDARKGRASGAAVPTIAAGGACGVLAWLAAIKATPPLAAGLAAALLVRTAIYTTRLRPDWSARRLGITEAAIGAIYVIALGLAFRQPGAPALLP